MLTQARVLLSALRFGRLLLAVVVIQLVPHQASAQGDLDALTPPGQAPGAPAGSYSLGDFDNVNLFNGHLNFHLPLVKADGRGIETYDGRFS